MGRSCMALRLRVVSSQRRSLGERGTIVFVEVKTRSPRAWQPPEAAVDADKRRRLRAAAKCYLGQYRKPSPCRLDIVSVDLDGDDRVVEIRHLAAAFDADGDDA